MSEPWLQWAQRLQAIAQNGLTYTEGPFDRDRYQQIRQIAAEMMASVANVAPATILDWFAQDEGYATPKIDVRGVVFHDDKLLLVKERDDQKWTLPGGWVDIGESPSAAIEREIWEESGYCAQAQKLLAIYDRNRHGHPPARHHAYKLFFQCRLLGGTAVTSIETEAAEFFAEHELPDLSLSRVVPQQLMRMFEHYRHPDWPTDFD